MKTRYQFLVLGLFISYFSFSQDTINKETLLEDVPLQTKHRYTAWRTDYYICTGIAYAKSMGQSVEEFAEFVGSRHSLTGPNDKSLSAVIRTSHRVMTNYPEGQFQILSE